MISNKGFAYLFCDAHAAILNANIRRAVYAAYSAHAVQAIPNGEENADDTLRNTLVPYTFATTSDGRSYGSIANPGHPD